MTFIFFCYKIIGRKKDNIVFISFSKVFYLHFINNMPYYILLNNNNIIVNIDYKNSCSNFTVEWKNIIIIKLFFTSTY